MLERAGRHLAVEVPHRTLRAVGGPDRHVTAKAGPVGERNPDLAAATRAARRSSAEKETATLGLA